MWEVIIGGSVAVLLERGGREARYPLVCFHCSSEPIVICHCLVIGTHCLINGKHCLIDRTHGV